MLGKGGQEGGALRPWACVRCAASACTALGGLSVTGVPLAGLYAATCAPVLMDGAGPPCMHVRSTRGGMSHPGDAPRLHGGDLTTARVGTHLAESCCKVLRATHTWLHAQEVPRLRPCPLPSPMGRQGYGRLCLGPPMARGVGRPGCCPSVLASSGCSAGDCL